MKIMVIRLGAIGDLMFITPVLQALKNRGDRVSLVCKPHGRAIFHRSPLVDRLHVWRPEDEAWVLAHQKGGDRPGAALARAAAEWGRDADEIIQLDDVIENHYLHSTKRTRPVQAAAEGAWLETYEDHTPWLRGEHPFRYDNYYEVHLCQAGLEGLAEPKPVWSVLPQERRWAAKFKRRHGLGQGPLVIIQLTGSGVNKAWPYWPQLAAALLRARPEARLVTLGVMADQVLEWDWAERDRRIIPLASRQTVRGEGFDLAWNRLRREAALIEAADLFIGPDTSLLHCAGSFATPKVALMSICHARNVLTHYKNAVGLQSAAPCSPCGKLTVDCYRGPRTGAILCMEALAPDRVLRAVLQFI